MTSLIPHTIEGEVVQQRVGDGYVNATAMCKAAGKRWGHYAENDTTKDFFRELATDVGIPVSELIQSLKGGPSELQGTWVHPQVAIHLAQWLSSKFAVHVSKWVYAWMTKGRPKANAEMSFHLRRYVLNKQNVPKGHFSVLTEMTLELVAPLELAGYTLPESLWPDISEGMMFANWLRANYDIELHLLPTYRHEFEDGRKPVFPRAYPNKLLADFREHLTEVWIATHSVAYFKTRDSKALPYLKQLLAGQKTNPALQAPQGKISTSKKPKKP